MTDIQEARELAAKVMSNLPGGDRWWSAKDYGELAYIVEVIAEGFQALDAKLAETTEDFGTYMNGNAQLRVVIDEFKVDLSDRDGEIYELKRENHNLTHELAARQHGLVYSEKPGTSRELSGGCRSRQNK